MNAPGLDEVLEDAADDAVDGVAQLAVDDAAGPADGAALAERLRQAEAEVARLRRQLESYTELATQTLLQQTGLETTEGCVSPPKHCKSRARALAHGRCAAGLADRSREQTARRGARRRRCCCG